MVVAVDVEESLLHIIVLTLLFPRPSAVPFAAVAVDADPESILADLRVSGQLLQGNGAFVAVTVLVEVEIVLHVGSLPFLFVDTEVALLVAGVVPVVDDEALALLVPVPGLDLASDRVVLALASVDLLREPAALVGGLALLILPLLALELVLGTPDLADAGVGIRIALYLEVVYQSDRISDNS